MDDNPQPKKTLEIPLHSIRAYVPGSGPPPPRISLAPPRDSTAYIIDQFALPSEKDMIAASTRRLLYYHIGFTDLPAAKLLVPCHKVLDYVSPRELEDWEYENLARKEEERARLLAMQRADAQKRKPGRPPKVPMEDVGVSAPSQQDRTLLLAEEVAGPSLSTPQKRRLGGMLDEETGDTSNMESDDAAIRRQLQGDPESEDMEFDDELEADSRSVDQLPLQYDTTSAETPSRASSLAPPLRELSRASSAATPTKAGLPNSTHADQTYAPSNGFTPGRIHPAWAHAFGRQNVSQIPATSQKQKGHARQKETPLAVLATSQPETSTTASIPGLSSSADASSKHLSPRVSTPDIGAGSPPAAGSSAGKRKAQPNGKGAAQEKQPKTKKPKIEPEPEPAADEWEVKDLLDDQWFVEHGVKVHKYLVLWEGDWPEDQNPTWEPAANVTDEALLKRYQKKKKAGLLKPPKKQITLHQYLGVRYSSVAEAFEAGIDEQMGPTTEGLESVPDTSDEIFLVTENIGDISANGRRPAAVRAPNFGSFDSMLARYKQIFPRA